MSNFDHEINQDVAAHLKANRDTSADYPGWDFHGTVWCDGERWFCEVRVHREVCEIIEADSPASLMAAVCKTYGED